MIINEEVIRQYGFQDVGVMADYEEMTPGFNYTVGLTEMNWPEFIIIGLPNDVAHFLITSIIEKYKKEESVPQIGDLIENLSPYTLRLGRVTQENIEEYMCQAVYYYGEKNTTFEALQIIWPDESGRYPDNPEFDERMKLPGILLAPKNN